MIRSVIEDYKNIFEQVFFYNTWGALITRGLVFVLGSLFVAILLDYAIQLFIAAHERNRRDKFHGRK